MQGERWSGMDEIAEAIGRMDANIDALRRELLGNGQPGRVGILEAEVRELRDVRNQTIGRHSIVSVLSGFVGAIVLAAFQWLVGHR